MAEYFCTEHNTPWFQKGKMKGLAHPIGDTGGWCNMPEGTDPAEAPMTQQPRAYAPPDDRQTSIEGQVALKEMGKWLRGFYFSDTKYSTWAEFVKWLPEDFKRWADNYYIKVCDMNEKFIWGDRNETVKDTKQPETAGKAIPDSPGASDEGRDTVAEGMGEFKELIGQYKPTQQELMKWGVPIFEGRTWGIWYKTLNLMERSCLRAALRAAIENVNKEAPF